MKVTSVIKVGVWDLQPASDGCMDIGSGSGDIDIEPPILGNGFTGV